jgi:DNA-binding HxlR family transcriptional regulator
MMEPPAVPARADLSRTYCPLGRTAELIGDRAVLLILRELFFKSTRFDAMAKATGLGPQLVSARLKMLAEQGIVERTCYQNRPPRYDYHLTAKGRDLFDLLYAMRNWGEKWAYEEGETGADYAVAYVHSDCGADVGTETHCPKCGERLGFGKVKARLSPKLEQERFVKLGS